MKTFEESIKELEETVENLEKGIALSKECNDILDKAEKKINILVGNDGNLEEKSFIEQD